MFKFERLSLEDDGVKTTVVSLRGLPIGKNMYVLSVHLYIQFGHHSAADRITIVKLINSTIGLVLCLTLFCLFPQFRGKCFLSDSETTAKSAPPKLFTIGILISLDALVFGIYSTNISLEVKDSFSPSDHSSYISNLIE